MSYLCASRFSAYQGLEIAATQTRTAGFAPLGVVFEATGTTSTETEKPFHDLLYIWDFDDESAGTFTNGRVSGLSKNVAYGAVAAHVYRTAGTYAPTLTVFDGKSAKTIELDTITVTATDSQFTGTNTIVVSTDGDFTGKPSGAAEVTESDFDVAMSNLTDGKRILFKRGQTFTASTTSDISAFTQGSMIGNFGSGDLPIVNASNISGALRFTVTSGASENFVIQGLWFNGSGGGDTGVAINFTTSAGFENFTIVDNVTEYMGAGIVAGGESGALPAYGFVIQENTITELEDSSGGNGIFGRFDMSGILGNQVGPVNGGEHCIRIQQGIRTVTSANTATTPAAQKTAFTLRGSEWADDSDTSIYNVISDNKFICGSVANTISTIAPSGPTQYQIITDNVYERNWLVYGAATQIGLTLTSSRNTVRNNVFDTTGGASHNQIRILQETSVSSPNPENNWIYNNSAYSPDTASNFRMVWLLAVNNAVGVNYIFNNAAYAPNDSVHLMVFVGTGTVATPVTGNNSTDAQIESTCPFVDTTPTDPNAGEFDPADYAVSGGDNALAVFDDFASARRGYGNTAPVMSIGAIA